MHDSLDQQKFCKSCNEALSGKYCYACGEKKIEDGDLSFQNLVKQSFNAITNLEAKGFKSFFLLFFRPGELTAEFCGGRRVRYMKPFQIFVLANVLFFLLLTNSDFFRSPSKWYFNNQYIEAKVSKIVENKEISKEDVALRYDELSKSVSKTAIIVLIPVLGIFLTLLFYKRKLPFGSHVVFSTHFFSFFLIYLVLGSFILSNIPNRIPVYYQSFAILGIFVYLMFSLKKVYKSSWAINTLLSAVLTVVVVLQLIYYRNLVSTFSLYWVGR